MSKIQPLMALMAAALLLFGATGIVQAWTVSATGSGACEGHPIGSQWIVPGMVDASTPCHAPARAAHAPARAVAAHDAAVAHTRTLQQLKAVAKDKSLADPTFDGRRAPAVVDGTTGPKPDVSGANADEFKRSGATKKYKLDQTKVPSP
jgi:hypothetical protein